MKGSWIKRAILCLGWCIVFNWLPPASFLWADDHTRDRFISVKHQHENAYSDLQKVFGGKDDEGNETTGQIVAWSLVAANLTVVLSVLIKGINRFAPLNAQVKQSLTKFNNIQKKQLMKLHYILNPIILGVAFLHYSMSRCRSTSLPEWGLLVMGGIVLLGVVLKFRLCSKAFLINIYRIHTQPALFILFITLLFIGHMIVD